MRRTKNDPGLEYMRMLGFKAVKSISIVEDNLAAVSDRKTAKAFLKLIDERSENPKQSDNTLFYEEKNQTLDFSLAVSSGFDADILRKACNWISEHKSYFGKEVLEVGCDCGIISCFLAKELPDSHVVSIDRCEAAIKNAIELARRFDIKNVDFICADLCQATGTFDTVFSMRTMHENGEPNEDPMLDLSDQADLFKASLKPYSAVLAEHLKQDGFFVSIERTERNALLLSWIEALSENGLYPKLEEYTELVCSELESDSTFQAFLSTKSSNGCIVNGEVVSPKELFHFCCSKYLDYGQAGYKGWDAKIIFDYRRKDLIEGYITEDKRNKAKSIVSLWTHNTDDTMLVFYYNNNGDVKTCFYDISQKDDLLDMMRKAVDEAKEYHQLEVRII